MWLSKSEGDKQILRELTCGTTAKASSPGAKDRTCKSLSCLYIFYYILQFLNIAYFFAIPNQGYI